MASGAAVGNAYQRMGSNLAIMCDCYEGEYEDIEVAVEGAERTSQVVPILVVKKRK